LTAWVDCTYRASRSDLRRFAKRWTIWSAATTPTIWSSVRTRPSPPSGWTAHVQLEGEASRSDCHDRRGPPRTELDEGEADFVSRTASATATHALHAAFFRSCSGSRQSGAARPRWHSRQSQPAVEMALAMGRLGNEYAALPSWRDWFAAVDVDAGNCIETWFFPYQALPSTRRSKARVSRWYNIPWRERTGLGTLVRGLPPELPLAESHFLAWSGDALDKPVGPHFTRGSPAKRSASTGERGRDQFRQRD